METTKQVSVQLANRPGRVSAILTAVAKEKVAIRSFSIMDCGQRGTLRFVPDDAALATSALQTINVEHDVADVLLVEISNQHGGLQRICQRLAEEHLNVDYAYSGATSSNGHKGGNVAVIKVNDLTKAQRILSEPAGANTRPKKRPGRRPAHAR